MKSRLNSHAGFTLIEVMIATAIMVVAFASILMVESSSINAATKARQMDLVAMLAKNTMIDSEMLIEGKTFSEIKEQESGQYPAPFQDFKWAREIKEIEFPTLASNGGDSDENQNGATQEQEMISKLIGQYLSKAIREVKVTVSWSKGEGEQNYSVSTYWVDLNHEFQVTQ